MITFCHPICLPRLTSAVARFSRPCCPYPHVLGRYDADSLNSEYVRDKAKGTPTGEPIHVPHNYYPDDDPLQPPLHTWKATGQVFYSNWVQSLIMRRWQRGRI